MKDEELAAIERRANDWSVDSGHIRNDCEALIAEVRRLRGAIEKSKAERESVGDAWMHCELWAVLDDAG